MSFMSREVAHRESGGYGDLIGASGGIVTIVLAVCGLSGINGPLMVVIATIVFGVALLVQGKAILDAYVRVVLPTGVTMSDIGQFGCSSLSAIFLLGAAGMLLGVLALFDINSAVLAPIATIVFGIALVLSGSAVRRICALKRTVGKCRGQARLPEPEALASEMAPGSASVQALAGITAIALGALAAAGNANDLTLNLVALLSLGSTLVLTSGSLSTTVLNLARPWLKPRSPI